MVQKEKTHLDGIICTARLRHCDPVFCGVTQAHRANEQDWAEQHRAWAVEQAAHCACQVVGVARYTTAGGALGGPARASNCRLTVCTACSHPPMMGAWHHQRPWAMWLLFKAIRTPAGVDALGRQQVGVL